MTMPVPSIAFDERTAHPLRMKRRTSWRDGSRAGALLVTAFLHVAAIAALVAGMHAAKIFVPPTITVQIQPKKPKPVEVVLPPPPQMQMQKTVVPVPTITVLPPPPPVVVQTVQTPAPPPRIAYGPGESAENYQARLLSQLNRFKRYPPEARRAHIEGVVMLHFIMDKTGHILLAEISKSSGRPALDNEALALMRRAEPLPAFPPNFPTANLDAIVPIEFFLNQ